MPDVQLAIRNATVEDTDAWNLTQLATAWGRRLPMLAVLKQYKDGKELVDSTSVPAARARTRLPCTAPCAR